MAETRKKNGTAKQNGTTRATGGTGKNGTGKKNSTAKKSNTVSNPNTSKKQMEQQIEEDNREVRSFQAFVRQHEGICLSGDTVPI